MQQAIQAVENGLSRHAAAKQYEVPLSTLRDCLRGAITVKQNAADRQALSDIQESRLAQRILV